VAERSTEVEAAEIQADFAAASLRGTSCQHPSWSLNQFILLVL